MIFFALIITTVTIIVNDVYGVFAYERKKPGGDNLCSAEVLV